MRLRRRAPEREDGDLARARRLLAGDEEAFDDFLREHMPGLYRFALARLRDPELTRDLVQTTLLNAIAHLRTYRGEASLAAWLYTICRNEIRAHTKRQGRTPAPFQLIEELPEVQAAWESLGVTVADPEAGLGRQELARLVHATLDHLPSHYGRALEWKYLDGLSVKEIASRLRLAPKAAESLLTRARQAFRDGFATARQEGLRAFARATT